jgi:hypothetical protein
VECGDHAGAVYHLILDPVCEARQMEEAKRHKDISIGIWLFCCQWDENFDEAGWFLKIWEGIEALVPYRLVLE